jgi:hypothetical protein
MYIKIENHNDDTTRVIDYPGDMTTFLWAHSLGLYNIVKIKAGSYQLVSRFDGAPFITVSKPGKREIAAYEREDK